MFSNLLLCVVINQVMRDHVKSRLYTFFAPYYSHQKIKTAQLYTKGSILQKFFKTAYNNCFQFFHTLFDRFPEDFMFVLTKHEVDTMVSQIVTPSLSYFWGAMPFAFTEHGILMLANVLKSRQALNVSLQIIRQLIAMRKFMILSGEFQEQLNDINFCIL